MCCRREFRPLSRRRAALPNVTVEVNPCSRPAVSSHSSTRELTRCYRRWRNRCAERATASATRSPMQQCAARVNPECDRSAGLALFGKTQQAYSDAAQNTCRSRFVLHDTRPITTHATPRQLLLSAVGFSSRYQHDCGNQSNLGGARQHPRSDDRLFMKYSRYRALRAPSGSDHGG